MSLKDIPNVGIFGRLQDFPEAFQMCINLTHNGKSAGKWWKAACVLCIAFRQFILAIASAGAIVWFAAEAVTKLLSL